jgi:hypothetical protein
MMSNHHGFHPTNHWQSRMAALISCACVWFLVRAGAIVDNELPKKRRVEFEASDQM